MREIGPMAALSRHSRRRASPMEKPVKGRLVVHPATAKSHFGLPPAENTVWPLVARVRSVWYVREREQKRLCFCSASRPLQSLESRAARSHLELGRSNVGAPASPPPPSPSPHPGPRGGAEVGVEVWCEAAAPLSPPTTSAEAVTRHQPPPPPRGEAAAVPRAEQARKPRVTEIQARTACTIFQP